MEITKYDLATKTSEKMEDYVAEEKPLHILVNTTYWATILCSPSNLKEMAVGHLLAEGILKSTEEIMEVAINEKEGTCHVKLQPAINLEERLSLSRLHQRVVTSTCGGQSIYQYQRKPAKVTSSLTVKAEVLFNAVNQLNFKAEVFRQTGGVHAAAVYTADGTLVAMAEDVGRHNAVDKVIGMAALKQTRFSECFLASTGRLSGDIVFKAAKVGLPIVASLGAALDSGVDMAEAAGLTLVGFVRGKRMNIYTLADRILS
ncbi:MAG: formate dehydrogenase accessory sulfurtransferase FdhD [Candidatus Bathyarchaeia archaeon]